MVLQKEILSLFAYLLMLKHISFHEKTILYLKIYVQDIVLPGVF